MTTFEQKLEELDRPMTADELCSRLSLTRDTLYDWTKRKKTPAYRIGKEWRFEPAEILKFCRDRKVDG
jgi:excisionase family DNA binding protein